MTQPLALRGRALALAAGLTLLMATVLPMFLAIQRAEAAQLTSRSVTIDKSGTTETDVEYLFGFTYPSTAISQAIRIQFCTTPLGSCTQPTGLNVSGYTIDAQSFSEATTWASQAVNENQCTVATGSNNEFEICLERTDPDPESAAGKTLTLSGINHTAMTANSTVYERITVYNDLDFQAGDIVHDGVVASAIVQTLTINARVQENLMFCVGSTSVNDAVTSPGADCTNISGTTVDLGVVDTTTTGAVSPDAEGNSLNGIAFLRTNANGGTSVGYKAVQQTGTQHQGALRVLSSTCSAVPNSIDQCFNTSTSQTNLAANTEHFGMKVGFENRASGGATTALSSTGTPYDVANAGYAWDETGTLANVASASGPVDDEALILRFAAVAAITTPTGAYQAQAKFIATPTF